MSGPPSDSRYRFRTATLDWARDEHATLGEWSVRRADPQRLRAALLTRWLRALVARRRR